MLMKNKNLNKIRKISLFEDNWNGNGGEKFSKTSIRYFETMIKELKRQPEIAPSGRGSLLMQYRLNDGSLLAFEVNEDKTEKVYIPKGIFQKAEIENFYGNAIKKIKESVDLFYS
ncbi:MAG: hypothetical protein [Caudoviricetes sp.]|nr:MAG: hypothetical protein [Caudoviricetes sp.]